MCSRRWSKVASGQIVKSVSLTPRTAMIVHDVLPSGKFSAFVRECLEQYAATMSPLSGQCLYPVRLDKNISKCNPTNTKMAKCRYCWPHGNPSNQDWKDYSSPPIFSPSGYVITRNPFYNNNEWIEEKSSEANPYLIDFSDYEQLLKEQAKKIKTPRQVGVLRRFFRWIY